MPDKYDLLMQHVPLFKGLSREEVQKIFSRGMTVKVLKDETVFHKGTVGNQMYVVLGGLIGVFDGDKRIAELRQGAMFGEMALVTHEPRSATARALEDSNLFVLSETTFQKLLTKRVAIKILLNIVGTMSTRLRETNQRLGG